MLITFRNRMFSAFANRDTILVYALIFPVFALLFSVLFRAKDGREKIKYVINVYLCV